MKEDQHIVPKVYLKRFTFDNKTQLYKLPIKSPYNNIKTKEASTTSICYEENYFTIGTKKLLEKYDISDPYFIEKEAFKYENDFLEKYLNDLCSSKVISKKKAIELVKIILSIKRRNTVMRDIFLNEEIVNKSLDKNLEIMEKRIEKFKDKFSEIGVDLDETVKKVSRKVKSDFTKKDFLTDLFRENFLEETKGISRIDSLINLLVSKVFYVYKTTEDYPFITNDNPGCTTLKNDEIVDTNFSDWEFYSFPIDPLHMLIIVKTHNDRDMTVFKNIKHILATKKFVDLANKASVINCNKLIISNKRELLDSLKDKYHKYYKAQNNA